MKKTTSQYRASLKELSKQPAKNICEMLRLVDLILQDQEYVDGFGGKPILLDQMELVEFAHFGGQPPLATMLRAFRYTPWKRFPEVDRMVMRILRVAASERVGFEIIIPITRITPVTTGRSEGDGGDEGDDLGRSDFPG